MVRLTTSRLLTLKAAHLNRKVIRGDLTSAFLHVDSEEPFCTVPDSQKIYCRRHNEEIARRQKTQELKSKFNDDSKSAISDSKSENSDSKSEISSEVLLALTRAIESGKFKHYQLKQNQAEQALRACLRK